MWDRPAFLDLPKREPKPRTVGVTHILDSGGPLSQVHGVLRNGGAYLDLVKIGWGLSYVDPVLRERVRLYQSKGILVCLGGTLFEVAAAQGRVEELVAWARHVGVDAIEVSNGLCNLAPGAKQAHVEKISKHLTVLAESGAKDEGIPVSADEWLAEMKEDLDAGARWAIAEGRESGTVGLYEPDGSVREWLVDRIVTALGHEQVIFEAPRKSQQSWFIRRYGPDVNLGNIALHDVLALETLRLGLRADTAVAGVSTA